MSTPSDAPTSFGGSAAPERVIALDMAKRSLPLAPLLLFGGAIGWGTDGALSVAFAIALVVANLVLSAAMLARAARISPTAVMAAALGGFLFRMLLVVVAVALVKDASWVAIVPLGLSIVVTHLALVIWESRHISATLAHPALRPRRS